MAEIIHRLVIKANPAKVYQAITTQEGIESWWCKQTTAKPEVRFVNTLIFPQLQKELKVTELIPNERVTWECLKSVEEWIGTTISFNLEEKDAKTILRFDHEGWRAITDTYASCNYDWARFLASLKSYCETGTGTPA